MNRRIFKFTVNEKTVLGFDTGLSAQAFAQAKMAQFITNPGIIVYPGGRAETWQPGGAAEYYSAEKGTSESIVVWGPFFPGERLTEIVTDPENRDKALAALGFWIQARIVIEEKYRDQKDPPFSDPGGVLVVTKDEEAYPAGTVLFPPYRLLKRTLEAEGPEAVLDNERWVHPELKGDAGISFSAGALLYRLFCGGAPFPGSNEDELRQDIREAVFVPPELAAPGLDPEMAGIISQSIGRRRQAASAAGPGPEYIGSFMGYPFFKPFSSWIRPLKEEEISKIRLEREQYSKKKALKVKTRRFMARNTAIIAGALIAAALAALVIRGIIQRQAELPTTRGMTPLEVVQAYYGAFGNLDHTLMQACVTGKAGKGDIDMVVNLYVITKVRQAYEMQSYTSAQEWADAGSRSTGKTVFGVTNLLVKTLSENQREANLEAEYILWMPPAYLSGGESHNNGTDLNIPVQPAGLVNKDILSLVFKKGAWHITQINRTSSALH